MTRDEALQIARAIAEEKDWSWLEPAEARASRRFLIFGKRTWHIYTNAECLGCNISIGIDDETGAILYLGFLRR